MDDRRWYEADALMADLVIHRHEIPGASEEEIAQRMRDHYPDAVAILVCERTGTKARFGIYMKGGQEKYRRWPR